MPCYTKKNPQKTKKTQKKKTNKKNFNKKTKVQVCYFLIFKTNSAISRHFGEVERGYHEWYFTPMFTCQNHDHIYEILKTVRKHRTNIAQ